MSLSDKVLTERKEKYGNIIYPASVTPFDAENRVNEHGMRALLEMNLSQGAKGFFIGGSSAECFLMNPEERKKTFEIASEYKDRAALIAHVGSIATHQAIDYARYAKELGYEMLAATPPFYYGFDSRAICGYYREIYEACGLPILIYNFPGNTGKEFSLSDPAYRELFTSECIWGVKHTNQVVYQLERIKNLNPDLLVFDGYDETMIAALALGADGAIGSTFNFMLPHYQKVYDAFHRADLEEARRLQIRANNIMNTLVDIGLFPAIKYILTQMGIDAGLPRKPFLPLTAEQKKCVDEVLKENLENE